MAVDSDEQVIGNSEEKPLGSKYAHEIEKRLRWHWRRRRRQSASWRVDETYVKFREE